MQDGRTLCPKNPMFLVFRFHGFWPENDVTRLTAKLKFQDMAKQINNFKKARCDRIECKKMFSKTRLQFVDLPASITAGTSTPPPPPPIRFAACFKYANMY